MKNATWSYGLTTVPERRETLLPETLRSLASGGFPAPRLFVDGAKNITGYESFGCDVTVRWPKMGVYASWLLGFVELFLRQPEAGCYAMFQDDVAVVRNLRPYLERCKQEDDTYWNLYTFPHNHRLAGGRRGFHPSDQMGKGGLALVFSRRTADRLFKSPYLINELHNAHQRHKALDGKISNSMKKIGCRELVHNPSLCQHLGMKSAMGKHWDATHLADSFPGEEFDAMELLSTEQKGQ